MTATDSLTDCVVDTSALAAILLREADAPLFLATLARPGRKFISAANRTEFLLVAIARLKTDGMVLADELLVRLAVRTQAVDETIAGLAAMAYARFGKGRHPAGLNYGDTFAYATARQLGLPLLYKGEDFSRTDVIAALPAATL